MDFKEMMLLYHHENISRIRDGKTKLLLFPFAVGYGWESIKQWSLRIICMIRGHQWEEKSIVGPDHASTNLECKRCGKTYTHIWY